jgi:hypothetical protein
VIDDEIEPESLHLLRLAPLAWFAEKEQTRFENMPTDFGPVTLKWQLADGGKTLRIDYTPKFRRPPKAVVLHVATLAGLQKVTINGQERAAKPGESIRP